MKWSLSIAFLFCVLISKAQEDNIGSGHALLFDGVDDYIDLGNIYDDIQLPVIISAWINLSTTTDFCPIFVSQDNAPVYNGFWFIVQFNRIGVGYGDGLGENLPNYRRSKGATIRNISGRWVYVTGIIRSALDMDLYVNGVNVGGVYTGSSNSPMSASMADVAKIGYWFSNGLTFHFKGQMDDLRIWNRSLSENEIRQFMCKKLKGNENGLIGYWPFNETNGNTILDKSVTSFNGTFVSNPQREYSGAPIGDKSKFIYPLNWDQITLGMGDGIDSIAVLNVANNPYGIHLFEVNDSPSQQNGLSTCYSSPYFGVFSDNANSTGIIELTYFSTSASDQNISLFNRLDNSIPDWNKLAGDNSEKTIFKSYDLLNRIEVIKVGAFNLDLIDTIVCDNSEYRINAEISDPAATYLWNTGGTSSSILVNSTGNYTVNVHSQCGDYQDTALVAFLKSPPGFSLETDENLCQRGKIELRPFENSSDFLYNWSDGSHEPSLLITKPGTYSVTVQNFCGERTDSISIDFQKLDSLFIPNVITPNGDEFNQNFEIDSRTVGSVSLFIFNRWGKEVYRSLHYKNNWNGGDLSEGVYYYVLEGRCTVRRKGSLTIVK